MTNQFPSSQIEGQKVLIVGGTSGIGLSAAIQAKGAGAEVSVLGSDPVRAAEVAAEHGLAGWLSADVTRPETIEAALSNVARVDHLVLLAGSFAVGKVLEADLVRLHRAFDERVWAAVHVLR